MRRRSTAGESGGRRHGRRRTKAEAVDDSDDGDEEYVAVEEESSGESSPATPGGSDDDEEEFQFGESSDEAAATADVELDDEDEEEVEEDDDDLLRASRSVRRRGSGNRPNGRMRKLRVSDEEDLEESRSKPPQRLLCKNRNGDINKFRVSDDDEEEEVGLENLRWKSRCASRKRNGTVNKFRVSDVDEECETQEISRPKTLPASCNSQNGTMNIIGVSNNDDDEELENGLASMTNETKSRFIPPKQNSVDSDYEVDEEEEHEDGLAPRIALNSRVRPLRRNSVYSDYEVDKEEEQEDGLASRRNVAKSSGRPLRRNSVDSDYEVDEEEEDDEEDYVDEDFSLDAEDVGDGEGPSNSKINNRCRKQKSGGNQKGRKKRARRSEYDDDFLVEEDEGRKRRPRRANYDDGFIVDEDKGRKRRSRRSEYDDDFIVEDEGTKRRPRSLEYDDDFIVEDDEDSKHRKRKKVGKGNKKKKTKRMAMKSGPEASNPDFVSSDDDFEEEKVALNNHRKRIKNVRKGNRGSRKLKTSSNRSESSSSLSDSDFEISEEELRDLGIFEGVNRPQPKRIFAERKEENKGKEKVTDESGKQVCGICLSEEQKRTVQGVLNCCTHYFCFACVVAWSKVESRCPVCKRRFETITKSSRSDSKLEPKKAVIEVQKRDQVYQPSEVEIRRMLDPYENMVCMECQQGGDDSLMLLCDICDSSAHTYCVGLGREVPEGNWYCECCRSATDVHPQTQDIVSDHPENNLEFSVRSIETEGAGDACAGAELQRPISLPGQNTIRGFDLNVSPRLDEDYVATSQASGGGASTLSGRREIHRRIRLILSGSRRNQNPSGSIIPHNNWQSDVITPAAERPTGSLHGSDGMILLNPVLSAGPCPQNITSSFQSNANLVPCTYNAGSSFRQVEGAKEQVQSMVKRHLKDLSRELQLEHATFKEIVSRSTHTILAACGIEHKRRMVSSTFHIPNNCSHYLDREPAHLVDNCCSFCFNSFVKDVVQNFLHAMSQSAMSDMSFSTGSLRQGQGPS